MKDGAVLSAQQQLVAIHIGQHIAFLCVCVCVCVCVRACVHVCVHACLRACARRMQLCASIKLLRYAQGGQGGLCIDLETFIFPN